MALYAGLNVEILDLRHFTSAELRPLLEHEAQLWSRLLDWDYRTSAEMILRYLDARILPGYAAVENGRVYGYSFFIYEGGKGVIGDLYVNGRHGTSERESVQTQLLEHVIETLQNSPGIHRVEAQLLVHDAGVVAGPFLREGFRRHARVFMTMPLGKTRRSAPGLPSEFELRPWTEADYPAAASVITAAYRDHVDAEINDQYRSTAGAMRFLNNIVRFPGCGVFDPGASFVAVHKQYRSPVGLILCSRIKEDVGHVTQLCVVPEYRGRRLGEVLIGASTADLRRRRFRSLSLTVTQANRRAIELYKRLGFTTQRVFDAFVWEG